MQALRRHYAKKEATEHMQAQNALARGDLKSWHRHEAKAHKAGSHAHHGGLMHTDYTMGKENLPPIIVPNEPPMVVARSGSSGTISPFLQPLPPTMGPIEVSENSLPANTIIEPSSEMEPTIVVEPMYVEEARTVVEYGEPIAPIMYVDEGMAPMGMGMAPAMGVGAAMAGMEEVVEYGEPQFVGETVTGY
jgi:hypothetical protein